METLMKEGGRLIEKYLKARDEEYSIVEELISDSSSHKNISIFNQETEKWTFYKSIINMLDFYRTELLGLLKGKNIVNLIPLGTRMRFIETGILRRFGTKFELTDRGKMMLLDNVVKYP